MATLKKTYCTVCPKWEIKRPERCSNTLNHKKLMQSVLSTTDQFIGIDNYRKGALSYVN